MFFRSGFTLILVMIMQHFSLHAQTAESDPPYRYSVAYFGNNLYNPGIKLGMEYAWRVKTEGVRPDADSTINWLSDGNSEGITFTGTKKHTAGSTGISTNHAQNRKLSLHKEWVPGANIGTYLDPGSHAALFSNAGIGYRRTNENGRTRYVALNPAGIYRSFLTETYAYNDQGTVEPVTLPGNLYYAPAFSVGFGKITDPTLQSGWFTHITVITLIPYNHWVMPLINLEAGIMFGKRGGAR